MQLKWCTKGASIILSIDVNSFHPHEQTQIKEAEYVHEMLVYIHLKYNVKIYATLHINQIWVIQNLKKVDRIYGINYLTRNISI